MTSPDTTIVDIDATLVDTNYRHPLAWYRAFRGCDVVVPIWRIHRHIGMGGDQLVKAVAGAEAKQRYGEQLRKAWTNEFEPMLDEAGWVSEPREDLRARLDETPRR